MDGNNAVMYVMFNPAMGTADAPDRTMNNIKTITENAFPDCNAFIIINLLAYKTADPRHVKDALNGADFATIRGPENIEDLELPDVFIDYVCFGWGGISLGRDWRTQLKERKIQMMADCMEKYGEGNVGVIALTAGGQPKHLGP